MSTAESSIYVTEFFRQEDQGGTEEISRRAVDREVKKGADRETVNQQVAADNEMDKAVYESIAQILNKRLNNDLAQQLFMPNDAKDIAADWAYGNPGIMHLLEAKASILIRQIELMLEAITGHKSPLHAARMLDSAIGCVATLHEVTIDQMLEDDEMRAEVIRRVTTKKNWANFLRKVMLSMTDADPAEPFRVLINDGLAETIPDPKERAIALEMLLSSTKEAVMAFRKEVTVPVLADQATKRLAQIWPPRPRKSNA